MIYDPFAGSGVTVDVCQEMGRRSYCSDLIPQRDEIIVTRQEAFIRISLKKKTNEDY